MAWKVIVGHVARRDLEGIREFIARDDQLEVPAWLRDPAAAISFCGTYADHGKYYSVSCARLLDRIKRSTIKPSEAGP